MKYLIESVKIFFQKENFIYFAKIQAFLLPVPVIFFIWSLILRFGSAKLSESLSAGPTLFLLSIALSFVNVVISLFVEIALIEAIRRVRDGFSLSVREAFRVAKSKTWKFFLLGLLKVVILAVGFLFLLIPGIIFAVWFVFSKFEVVLHQAGVRESLAKSKALVGGRFWWVLGRLLIFEIFAVLAQIVFALLPYSLGTLVSLFFVVLFILPFYLLFKELEGREDK